MTNSSFQLELATLELATFPHWHISPRLSNPVNPVNPVYKLCGLCPLREGAVGGADWGSTSCGVAPAQYSPRPQAATPLSEGGCASGVANDQCLNSEITVRNNLGGATSSLPVAAGTSLSLPLCGRHRGRPSRSSLCCPGSTGSLPVPPRRGVSRWHRGRARLCPGRRVIALAIGFENWQHFHIAQFPCLTNPETPVNPVKKLCRLCPLREGAVGGADWGSTSCGMAPAQYSPGRKRPPPLGGGMRCRCCQ